MYDFTDHDKYGHYRLVMIHKCTTQKQIVTNPVGCHYQINTSTDYATDPTRFFRVYIHVFISINTVSYHNNSYVCVQVI